MTLDISRWQLLAWPGRWPPLWESRAVSSSPQSPHPVYYYASFAYSLDCLLGPLKALEFAIPPLPVIHPQPFKGLFLESSVFNFSFSFSDPIDVFVKACATAVYWSQRFVFALLPFKFKPQEMETPDWTVPGFAPNTSRYRNHHFN